jgi:hypothetical protein
LKPNKALNDNQFDLAAVDRQAVIQDESWTKDCTEKSSVKAQGQSALKIKAEFHIKYPQPPLPQGQDLPHPKVNFLNELIYTEIKIIKKLDHLQKMT